MAYVCPECGKCHHVDEKCPPEKSLAEVHKEIKQLYLAIIKDNKRQEKLIKKINIIFR